MGSSKTPGNDGLTKELYLCIWSEIKEDLVNSLNEAYLKGALSTTQKQIIITLLEKPGKDNRVLDSWRPISLINVDVKVCSRVLSNRMAKVLPYLISPDQAAFIKGRNIDEVLRTIKDLMEYLKQKNENSLLFAADFEKAFDSIERNFIFAVLHKFGFDEKFIKWIKTLLFDNQGCVMNNGKTTDFFEFKRGTKQGDPISPYIFILIIEIMAIMIRSCQEIKGIKIGDLEKKLLLFADDTTFFLKDISSFQKVLKELEKFKLFSSLNINVKKSEVGWLNNLRNRSCRAPEENNLKNFKWIDFYEKGLKILGIFFSYNDKYSYENNFKRILTNFQTILSLWKTRNLTLYGKIQILRALALPKLMYVCSVLNVPEDFIKIVESTIRDFIWYGKKPKIKHSTLIGEYEEGGLKLPDFQSCLNANRVKWLIKLYQSYEENTLVSCIPSLFCKSVGGLKHINKNFDQKRIPKNIPDFYKSILIAWSKISDETCNSPNAVYNQHLWNNKHIQIEGKSVLYKEFSEKNINKIFDLCDRDGEFNWEHAKMRGLVNKDFLKWAGIVHAIPKEWKTLLKENNIEKKRLQMYINFGNTFIDVVKLKTKMLYSWFIAKKFKNPTAQANISRSISPYNNLDWTVIYNRIYKTSIDTYSRYFQFKILNNILYLNRDLNRFKILEYASCSFCFICPETVYHLFVDCIESKNFYFDIRIYFENFGVIIPESNYQNIILGVDEPIINFIILHFKIVIYKFREKRKRPSLNYFLNILRQNRIIEYKIAKRNNVLEKHRRKWVKIEQALN